MTDAAQPSANAQATNEPPEIVVEQACADPECETVRTDEPDYSPIQVMTGQPLGWYSGDDGEFCPKHIAELMTIGNRRAYQYWLPGRQIAQVGP